MQERKTEAPAIGDVAIAGFFMESSNRAGLTGLFGDASGLPASCRMLPEAYCP